MASRRQIREAVVQFLYCADIEGGPDPRTLREPFWDFLTESDRRTLQVATFRTIAHLAQGRDGRLAEFLGRCAPALAKLGAFPEAESLRSLLQRLVELEHSWTAAFATLDKLPTDDSDKSHVAGQFASGLARLFRIDAEVTANRRNFLEGLDDFPVLRGPMEPVAASLRRLQRISDRVAMTAHPDRFPDQGDLAKLRETLASINTLRERTDQMVDAVLVHRGMIDDSLAAVVENFSPERIDPVDRAVLRLAVYELAHTTTPTKVILNEAIELARRFGTTESHRFVNGLLDPLARLTRPG